MFSHLSSDAVEWIWCVPHRLHLVVTSALGFWCKEKTNNQSNSASDTDNIESAIPSTRNKIVTATFAADQYDEACFDDSIEGKFSYFSLDGEQLTYVYIIAKTMNLRICQ